MFFLNFYFSAYSLLTLRSIHVTLPKRYFNPTYTVRQRPGDVNATHMLRVLFYDRYCMFCYSSLVPLVSSQHSRSCYKTMNIELLTLSILHRAQGSQHIWVRSNGSQHRPTICRTTEVVCQIDLSKIIHMVGKQKWCSIMMLWKLTVILRAHCVKQLHPPWQHRYMLLKI